MANEEIVELANEIYQAMLLSLGEKEMTGGEMSLIISMAVVQLYKDVEEDNPEASAIVGLALITEKIRGIVQAMEESDEEDGRK